MRLLWWLPFPAVALAGATLRGNTFLAVGRSDRPTETPNTNAKHEWSYSEPEVWGDDYSDCAAKEQSPVDFDVPDFAVGDEAKRTLLGGLVDYKPLQGRKVVNHDNNEQVNGEFGILKLPNGDYEVKQFHFHFPSEHAVNGQHAAGEIHIVHQRKGSTGTDGLAVIGILLQEEWAFVDYSTEDRNKELDFLTNLGFGTDAQPGVEKEEEVKEGVDLNAFSHELGGPYFHYQGSLTTPPCSETVHWYVLQRPAVVTAEMVASVKKKYQHASNNRPVQRLNGRKALFSELAFPAEFEATEVIEARQAEAKADKAASEAVSAEAKAVMQQAKVAVGDAEQTAAKAAQVAAEAEGGEEEAKKHKEKAAEIKEDLREEKKELKEVREAANKAQEKADDSEEAAEKADEHAETIQDVVDDASHA